MFRFTKAALNLSGVTSVPGVFVCTNTPMSAGQAGRQVRHGSTAPQNFHMKYGNGLIVGGAAFCVAVWSYVLTQTGITWNLSPVGKIQPMEWRQADAEEEE